MLSFSWKSRTSATILPVSSEVRVCPGLPTDERLQIISGMLKSEGGLQASDADTYMITLLDYFGTAELIFRISGKFEHCTSCVHVLDISWNYNP